MAYDKDPRSSTSSHESEHEPSIDKVHQARRLVNVIKTRWYDYEQERRKSGIKSQALRDEIVALTSDLEEELSFITVHLEPKLTASGDLFLVQVLRQEVADSIEQLKML